MTRFAVLFAMPIDRSAFMSAAEALPISDYMRLTLGGDPPRDVWERRYEGISNAAQSLLKSLQEWGIPMFEQATLADLRQATLNADVVILFAHWCPSDRDGEQKTGRLELADGLHAPEDVEAAISGDFRGTVDLCSCTSEIPAGYIKRRRGDAVSTIFNTELLDPLPAYVIVRRLIVYCWNTGADYRLARLQAARDLRRGT